MRNKYSLKFHLLTEAKKISAERIVAANTKKIAAAYGPTAFKRPCGYEVLVQDTIAGAGLGPSHPGGGFNFCCGTSTGADCVIKDKDGNDVQVEVKSGSTAPSVKTAVGAFGPYQGDHVWIQMKANWDDWKNTVAHQTLWENWITRSLNPQLWGPSRAHYDDKKLIFSKPPKGKAEITLMAKKCVSATIAMVDGQCSNQTVSGLKFPYMVSSPSNSVKSLGAKSYSISKMNNKSTQQNGDQTAASFVGGKYAAIPYIQIEAKGFFRVTDADPMGFVAGGVDVPVAVLSNSPNKLKWVRAASADSLVSFPDIGVSFVCNSYYIAESGGTNTSNISPVSLHNPEDCAKLAAAAKKAGTI
jgi:hypothetical protein